MCRNFTKHLAKHTSLHRKTAAGLADLTGMCDGGKDFKDMMNVVVGLPAMIQQQAEVKIKEAEERKVTIQDRTEIVSIKNLDQLMVATIFRRFKDTWEDPEFEATEYLAAIFEFWLRKGMFPE